MRNPIKAFWGVALFLLAASATAHASGWPAEARHWAQLQDQSRARFDSGNVATVWGAVRRKIDAFFQEHGEETLFPSRAFARGGVPVAIRLQQKDGRPVRAPLAVFMTGVFGTNHDPVALTMLQHLQEAGYHVLALNNPWSVPYREAKPRDPPGNLEAEARIVLELIEQARSRIGKPWVSTTRLVGVSYGGFLAHVAYALDSRSPHPSIDAGLLAFSPPADFKYALARMDVGIARARMLKSRCSGWPKVRDGLSYAWLDSEDSFSSRTLRCADHLLFSDFVDRLTRTTQVMRQDDRWQSAWESVDLSRELNFHSFQLGITHPSVVPVSVTSDPGLKLKFWLKQLRGARRLHKVRILAAEDDFVNVPHAWQAPELARLIPPENLLLLRWGGHFGYTPRPEFTRILNSALKSSP